MSLKGSSEQVARTIMLRPLSLREMGFSMVGGRGWAGGGEPPLLRVGALPKSHNKSGSELPHSRWGVLTRVCGRT